MSYSLSTTVSKINLISNGTNRKFHFDNWNCYERLIICKYWLHSLFFWALTFPSIMSKGKIKFLHSGTQWKRSTDQDPDRCWITTWNHNLNRIKERVLIPKIKFDNTFFVLGSRCQKPWDHRANRNLWFKSLHCWIVRKWSIVVFCNKEYFYDVYKAIDEQKEYNQIRPRDYIQRSTIAAIFSNFSRQR
jgi:hypothetical protein